MKPLISVIVPIYKSEQYLSRCVLSIINQTYNNLEIILVDDGSPDLCPFICDEFSKRDDRIKVVHKKNGGVSSARNTGITICNGHFLTFVDSDDVLPINSIELMYNSFVKYNVQFVSGICKLEGKNKYKNYINEEHIINLNTDVDLFLNYLTQSGSYSPYAKLFYTSIVKDNDILYREDLKCSEDAVFV